MSSIKLLIKKAISRRNILKDEIIQLTGTGAGNKCTHQPRRVVVWDKEKEKESVREVAFSKLDSEFGEQYFVNIAKYDKHIGVRAEAIKKVKSMKVLLDIAKNDYWDVIRFTAKERLKKLFGIKL